MNPVVHFELPADDTARIKAFYEKAFGWRMKDYPEMQYTIATTTEPDASGMRPKEPGAINGGIFKRTPQFPAPSLSIGVGNIEEAIEKIKLAGGTIIKDVYDVGGFGKMANFADTEGNLLSLWQPAKS